MYLILKVYLTKVHILTFNFCFFKLLNEQLTLNK